MGHRWPEVLGSSPRRPVTCEYRDELGAKFTYLLLNLAIHSRKVDIIFLNNAWVERIEIHDEDKLIPKTTLRLKHKTTLVLVPLAFRGLLRRVRIIVISLQLDGCCCFLAPCLVRADILQAVKFMK